MEEEQENMYLEINDEEVKRRSLSRKASNYKFKFYFFSIIAMFLLGTKMVCIGVTKINKFWVNFIEHIAIFFTALICYSLVRASAKKRQNEHLDKIFRDKRILLCCIICGIFDCFGNLTLIFSILFAFDANISPASVNCLLMTNAVLALIFGLTLFKERHTGIEYIGALLIAFSVVLISLQRSSKGSFDSNLDKIDHFTSFINFVDDESYQKYVYLSVLMVLISAFCYGITGLSSKYSAHFYKSYSEEFSMIFMMISGLIGFFSGVILFIGEVKIEPAEHSSLGLSIVGSAFAGVFTTLGTFSTIKSISYGSLEVALIFVNMRVIVQTIEELLIFKIFPSLISCFGVIIALVGSSIMIMYEHKEAHTHKEGEEDYSPM